MQNCVTLHVLVLAILVLSDVTAGGSRNPTRSSRWLKDAEDPRRPTGCWSRPWICNHGEPPFRWKMMCCRNQCVNVSSDLYNCGFCGIRCPFTWQCCNGRCVDTNINPFHCGQCWHRCPFGSLCFYGLCGYAQPLPPYPFPFPPVMPQPPHLPEPPEPYFPYPPPSKN